MRFSLSKRQARLTPTCRDGSAVVSRCEPQGRSRLLFSRKTACFSSGSSSCAPASSSWAIEAKVTFSSRPRRARSRCLEAMRMPGGDAEHPGPQRALAPERAQLREDDEQDLLRRVLGVLRVAQHPQTPAGSSRPAAQREAAPPRRGRPPPSRGPGRAALPRRPCAYGALETGGLSFVTRTTGGPSEV